MNKKFLALLAIALLIFAACGGGRTTGSEELLEEVGEGEEGCRLGQNCTPTPSPQTETAEKVGVGEPEPQKKEAPPRAQEQFFEIHLVGESPYYFDATNGAPASAFRIPLGYTLRVTNKDTTDTRPTRSFTSANGAFSSPDMKLGETWTYKFPSGGSFDLVDRCCPYVNGKLTVG